MWCYVSKVLNFLTFDITHIIAKAAGYKLHIYPGASEINLADTIKINQYQNHNGTQLIKTKRRIYSSVNYVNIGSDISSLPGRH